MYRKILLAYDGSRDGREALRHGADLARSCQAEVVLLAVFEPSQGVALAEGASPTGLTEREREDVQQSLEEGLARLRRGGLTAEARLGHGNPAEQIGLAARDVGADLIVVGHREQGRLARWWRGSVGASLIANAPCSVLVAVESDR